MRRVDSVVEACRSALARTGQTCEPLERLLNEMPRESEMTPRDKYTVFDRKEGGLRRYRKGIHKVPKWTKITVNNRRFPPGF